MPPKPRGGKKTGLQATPAGQTPTASPGDDSDEASGRNGCSSFHDFEDFVRATLTKLVDGQKQLEDRLAASIEFNSERISDLEKAREGLEREVHDLKAELSSVKAVLEKHSIEINKQERFSRRNNFRVVAVSRTQGENCMQKIADMLTTRFGWAETPMIERAHRDGPDRYGRPAHILVKMLRYQDKLKVMREHRKALEGTPMFILDDLTAMDRIEKQRWKKEVKDLYENDIKLRFSAGRWRNTKGVAFEFNRAT